MIRPLEDYRQTYQEAISRVRWRPELDVTVLEKLQAVVPFSFRELSHIAAETSVRDVPAATIAEFARALTKLSDQLRNDLFNFLTPVDTLAVPGAILLYGAAGTSRARQAAGLYQKSPQPIIVSDGAPDVQQRFIDALLERDVAAADIWPEQRARNYLENAYYSLKLLDERSYRAKHLYVVTESLAALRGALTTRCFTDDDVCVLSSPIVIDAEHARTDPSTPNSWYQTEVGVRLALREILKVYLFDELKLIRFAHDSEEASI